jgi:hypothetical protein
MRRAWLELAKDGASTVVASTVVDWRRPGDMFQLNA